MNNSAQWYRIAFTNEQIFIGTLSRVGLAIARAFDGAGRPKEAAVFASEPLFSDEPGDEGTTLMFFSPEAARCCAGIIRSYSGSPCNKPPKEGLSLMIGNTRAWSLLG